MSAAARDADVEGCEVKLTMYPGALEAFDRVIAADPGFALAHCRQSARTARARRRRCGARGDGDGEISQYRPVPREASHVACFDWLVAGDAEAALVAVCEHLNALPRDALVLATTAFTNGLIGSSGRGRQKRMLLALLEGLEPHYGDDWWFTAHHGMALSENGQRAAARRKIDRSLEQNPKNPWAAHARAHLCYEDGEPEAAWAFLASWLTSYPRAGTLYSHLSWHFALGHLEMDEAAAAFRLFREAFAPEVHSGPSRGKLTDTVSFLWRWELAGHAQDEAAWRAIHEIATGAFPHAERNVDCLVAHRAFIADLDPQCVEEDQRIGRLQRARLPGGDFLEHRVGHRADQVRRDVNAVEIAQMADDLAGAHAAGVHRDDLVVEPRKAALVLGDQLRVEACLAVARHRQLDLAGIGDDRLLAITISPVARLFAGEVMVHLGVEHPFRQGLLQIVDQAIGIEGGLRIGPGQQLVKEGVRDMRLFASRHRRAPLLRSCPTAARNSRYSRLGRRISASSR
jgi:tetratricopeptide (TPR) repeat protein